MNENTIRYFSLDEAREEIKKRWNDVELKKKIEEELGELFIKEFNDSPRAISFRQIISPDNGFALFYMKAKYLNTEPLVMEYKKDIFVSFNEEKKGLGKLRVTNNGKKGYFNILDFHANEKILLDEVKILDGQLLIDFHHNLMNKFGYNNVYRDYSDWFKKVGNASSYYYPLLLHCVAHGVFFETLEGDEYENNFTKSIIMPTIEKILVKYGVKPIIVQLYPEKQTDLEDFFWWSYPPYINEYLSDLIDNGTIGGKFNIINTL
jgi:hypothetical protein